MVSDNGLVIINSDHNRHAPITWSAEAPYRVEYIERTIKTSLPRVYVHSDEFNEDILKLVHDSEYIDSIKGGGTNILDEVTYYSEGVFHAALSAAGASIRAMDAIKNGRWAFAVIRPPGHHADTKNGGGFCIFNNISIATMHALEQNAKRIAIIDLDAHAGNGTMRIFYARDDVLFISIHEDPHTSYPYQGFANEMGHKTGYGYTINIEMPPTSGDREYKLVMDRIVLPVLKDYDPDVLAISMGFDTYHADRFSNLLISQRGFYHLGCKLKSIGKRMMIVLEGGYSDDIGILFLAFIAGIGGIDLDLNLLATFDISSILLHSSQGVYKKTEQMVKERIDILSDFFNIN